MTDEERGGVVMPTLVDEKRLSQLCYESCEFRCRCCKPTDCDEQCVPEGSRFFAGARAFEKELGIVAVVSHKVFEQERRFWDGCRWLWYSCQHPLWEGEPGCNSARCPISKGPVLVRTEGK